MISGQNAPKIETEDEETKKIRGAMWDSYIDYCEQFQRMEYTDSSDFDHLQRCKKICEIMKTHAGYLELPPDSSVSDHLLTLNGRIASVMSKEPDAVLNERIKSYKNPQPFPRGCESHDVGFVNYLLSNIEMAERELKQRVEKRRLSAPLYAPLPVSVATQGLLAQPPQGALTVSSSLALEASENRRAMACYV